MNPIVGFLAYIKYLRGQKIYIILEWKTLDQY